MKQSEVKRKRGRPRRELVFIGSNSYEYILATIENDFDNIFRCYQELPAYDEPLETGFVTKRDNELHVFWGDTGKELWEKYNRKLKVIKRY